MSVNANISFIPEHPVKTVFIKWATPDRFVSKVIESVAYLYGKSIKNTDVDLDLLAGLEEKSRFNMIRFISLDGTDYASDGKVKDHRSKTDRFLCSCVF